MDSNDPKSSNSKHILSLVHCLCSTLISNQSDNFENICRYSLDLICRKKIQIEDCEEQYLLSKIRNSFLKESKLQEWSKLQDLYLKLKSSTCRSVKTGELLYCLFLLSNSNSNQKQSPSFTTIFSISNNIESLKLANDEINLECHRINNNTENQIVHMRKNIVSSNQNNRHTVHGYINANANQHIDYHQLLTKNNLLAQDLIFIFQGLQGKHIKFQSGNFTFDPADLFTTNEIHFAKRLSILGQNFQTIKIYSTAMMNKTSSGLVVQSFGSALNDEINGFYKLVTSIQAKFHNPKQIITMLQLCIYTSDSFKCFDALVNLVSKCRSKKGGALISVVYDSMHHGDPIVRECIRRILSKVVKPIRKMLNHWIFYGELKDEYKEFFICPNDNDTLITSLNNVFWFDQYSINKQMLPGFISELQAYKILISGKATSMLIDVSMNQVSAVLPLYDQLKNSFENSNLETLFDQKYSQKASEFADLLDYAYKEISRKALQILNAKYMLYEHFLAHKRFLLFEKGDFIDYLMESLHPLISRPVSNIRPYALAQILETAIRKTSAQYEPEETLSRLDICFDRKHHCNEENAYDIFTLKYRIHGPIGSIFNEQAQVIYSRLFALFWKTKSIEFSLMKNWIDLKNISKRFTKNFNVFLTISIHFDYLHYQIIQFTKTIQQYFNYLLESCWQQVQNELNHPRNLNKLIRIHQIFLKNLLQKFFSNQTQSLTTQHENINNQILNFNLKTKAFIQEISKIFEKDLDSLWREEFEVYEKDINVNFNFWLFNFSRILHKEIQLYLELLIDTDEDDLKKLCFNIDFNRYYKMHNQL